MKLTSESKNREKEKEVKVMRTEYRERDSKKEKKTNTHNKPPTLKQIWKTKINKKRKKRTNIKKSQQSK